MIVRVPSLSEDAIARQEYQQLFEMVGTLVSEKIESLSDYYRVLNDPVKGAKIRAEENGQYLRINLTEPMADIDLDKRSVLVPDEFTKTGAIVRGDHLAEVIFFKVARYFDEMDLSACECEIECIAADGAQYRFPAYAMQIIEDGVSTIGYDDPETAIANEGFLIFGWLISEEVTALEGNATFTVRFFQTRPSDGKTIFNITTSPNTIKILPSFQLKGAILDHQEFDLKDYRGELGNRVIYSGVINSMGLKPIIVSYSWADIPFLNFTDETGVTVTIVARDLDSNVQPLLFRWLDETGTEVTANVTSGKQEETEYPMSSCKLTKAGTYYAMVGNYVDDKGDIVDPETGLVDYDRVAWISSQPIFVPSAADVTLSLEGVPLKGYTTSNGFTSDFQPITSITVGSSVAENPNGKFVYTWYRNGENINVNSDTLAITQDLLHGDYHVSAHYEINGTRSAEVSTEDTPIILRPAPVIPDAALFSINADEQNGKYECLPVNADVDIDDLYYYWSVYDSTNSATIVVQTWSRNNFVSLTDIEKVLGDKSFSDGDKLTCMMKQVRFSDDAAMLRESKPSDIVSYNKINPALL